MALSQERLNALAAPLWELFKRLERDLIKRIAAHINDIGKLTATDVHRLDELRRVGFNLDGMRKDIADTVSRSEQEIYDLFKTAAETEYAQTYNILGKRPPRPFSQNEPLRELTEQISQATHDSFVNFSKTTGFMASGDIKIGGSFLPLAEYYQKTIDYAVLSAKTGQTDFYSAMRSAVKELAANGLRTVDYASGYSRRIDSSVRMNLLGGMASLSRAQAEIIGKEFGADGYEITYHSGHRPTHDFGGQQFSERDYYRDILPLMEEPNCYHRSFPIILGISTPAYTKEQLQELERREAETHEFEGKGYNAYEAQQKQRRYELAIRKQKDLVNGFQVAGNKQAAQNARIKLRMLNGSYKEFSKAVGLQVNPKRAVGMAKSGGGLQTAGKSGIINMGGRKGAGAADGFDKKRADLLYEEIRKHADDAKKISANTQFTEKAVEEIRQHMFFKEHDLGSGEIGRFDSDIYQAEAWNRLVQGKHTETDVMLLKHEYVELVQMEVHGYNYKRAHNIANRYHNWWEAFKKEHKINE